MHALRNIPGKSKNKIRPSFQLPHFHEQGWKKKNRKITANKETNKTQYNSFYLILFFKIMRCQEHLVNFRYFD